MVVSRNSSRQIHYPLAFYHSVGNSYLLPCLCLYHRWNTLDINRIKQIYMNTLPIAIKFVSWDIPALETLENSKVYALRVKLNNGGTMDRAEKNWLAENVRSNSYFRTAVPLQGYRFDFSDVLHKYLVNQYGSWNEYHAPDKTSLRAAIYGRINEIVEIK